MSLFYTADPHLGHRWLATAVRGFASVEEMNQLIIDRWNAVVGKDDHVCVLGDHFMGHPAYYESTLSKLQGHKRLVLGNHDRLPAAQMKPFFEALYDRRMQTINTPYGQRRLCLEHYPMHTWNGSFHGSWLLCGHTHGMLQESLPTSWQSGLMLDVGMDVWGMAPVSLDEIIRVMRWKELAIEKAGGLDVGDYKRKGWPQGPLPAAREWSAGARKLPSLE